MDHDRSTRRGTAAFAPRCPGAERSRTSLRLDVAAATTHADQE